MSVIAIVSPVFVLILVGYAAARSGFLSAAAQKGLSEFTFSLAVPALLFRTVATGATLPMGPVPIWISYFGAIVVMCLAMAVVTLLVLRRPAADIPSIAMTATYGNIVMLGIPLNLAIFGEAAAAPMAVILAINTPLFWIVGTLVQQFLAGGGGRSIATVVVDTVRDLSRNPLIIAILAGGAWRLSGLPLPAFVERPAALLGQAGVPASLVALGVGLAGFAIKGQGPTLAAVVVAKLVLLPALAYAIAVAVGLPPTVAGVITVFAAVPAGANSYLFAVKVDRAVNSASGAVALGTALSVVTISAIVALIRTH